jgi:hypothetical protein
MYKYKIPRAFQEMYPIRSKIAAYSRYFTCGRCFMTKGYSKSIPIAKKKEIKKEKGV